MNLTTVRLITSPKFHKLTAAESSGQLDGPTTSDGDGLCVTDRDASMCASSIRSVSSNASMRSINPTGDRMYVSLYISFYFVSSNLYSMNRDASMYAPSNMSLHSASSNASMWSMNHSISKPPAVGKPSVSLIS